MSNQGAGGAYEISSRMTALIGWAATTDFAEKWVSLKDLFYFILFHSILFLLFYYVLLCFVKYFYC